MSNRPGLVPQDTQKTAGLSNNRLGIAFSFVERNKVFEHTFRDGKRNILMEWPYNWGFPNACRPRFTACDVNQSEWGSFQNFRRLGSPGMTRTTGNGRDVRTNGNTLLSPLLREINLSLLTGCVLFWKGAGRG